MAAAQRASWLGRVELLLAAALLVWAETAAARFPSREHRERAAAAGSAGIQCADRACRQRHSKIYCTPDSKFATAWRALVAGYSLRELAPMLNQRARACDAASIWTHF